MGPREAIQQDGGWALWPGRCGLSEGGKGSTLQLQLPFWALNAASPGVAQGNPEGSNDDN